MFSTAFFSLVLALQGAGQTPPTPPAKPPATTTVSASIPDKYVAPAPGPGSAVAKVDGQPIYGHDVEALVWELIGPQAVEDYINLIMVRQAAAKENIHVTPAEVEKRLKEDIKLYDDKSKQDGRRPRDTTAEAYLAQQGYPLSRLYLNTEIEVILDKMAEKTFNPESFVKVSLMLFKPDAATPAALATAQQNAQGAVTRMRAGTSKWETEIAKSQMPAEYISKAGLIGWLDEATFPADVLPKIKSLQPGQITDPIKVEQGGTGYEVFRLEDLGSKAGGADLETLKSLYSQAQHRKLLDAIRTAAKIDRYPSVEPISMTPPAQNPPAQTPPPVKKS